ncbi:MAG: hypothetical protein JO139_07535 [Alphaproteobacteria bacterium]|nr:hypothetical protein [Alphaproteobacteria bacterium]
MPIPRPLDKFQESIVEAAARQMIETGGTASREKLMEEFGVGEHAAQLAITRAKGRFEAAQIDLAQLSLTAQQKVDIAIRQRAQELEAAHEQRVRDEVRRRLEETILPRYKERLADAERVLKARKGVMDRATYRKIRACLHPDRVQDPELKERYEEAFNLFNRLESVLLDEKELPTPTLTIPTTLNELMKLKKKMAERRATRHGSGDLAER